MPNKKEKDRKLQSPQAAVLLTLQEQQRKQRLTVETFHQSVVETGDGKPLLSYSKSERLLRVGLKELLVQGNKNNFLLSVFTKYYNQSVTNDLIKKESQSYGINGNQAPLEKSVHNLLHYLRRNLEDFDKHFKIVSDWNGGYIMRERE